MTTTSLSPERLDERFVPRFRQNVTAVPVAEEAVLYEEDTGNLHRLDRVATIVCSLFDGATSVEQAVAELAAAFEAPRDVVEADVLEMVRVLGRKGLLDGVRGSSAEDDAVADGC